MNSPDRPFLEAIRNVPSASRARQLIRAPELASLLRQIPAVMLIEVGWGQLSQFKSAHIPGASYLDTSELETAPLFNKIDDDELLALLLARGIDHNATVLLYGRSSLAAGRAAHLLLYAGVADVRLLDGGFACWVGAGLPCEAGPSRIRPALTDFGAAFPLCPHFLTSADEARRDTTSLVSVRTWSEFSGASSGYSYIEARGDIALARWGRAGREGDVNSMSEYQHPDGRMLPAAAIARMWEAQAIVRERLNVFYCGTGWRASLAFFYAWHMGWEQISVFDGGWFEWCADPANPVVIRIDAPAAA